MSKRKRTEAARENGSDEKLEEAMQPSEKTKYVRLATGAIKLLAEQLD